MPYIIYHHDNYQPQYPITIITKIPALHYNSLQIIMMIYHNTIT